MAPATLKIVKLVEDHPSADDNSPPTTTSNKEVNKTPSTHAGRIQQVQQAMKKPGISVGDKAALQELLKALGAGTCTKDLWRIFLGWKIGRVDPLFDLSDAVSFLPGNWLTGLALQAYGKKLYKGDKIAYISPEMMSSLEFPYRKDPKRASVAFMNDINGATRIIINYNINDVHWILLWIDIDYEKFLWHGTVYEPTDLPENKEIGRKAIEMFTNACREDVCRGSKSLPFSGWDAPTISFLPVPPTLLQRDGFNCGIFVMVGSQYLAARQPIPTTVDIVYQRKRKLNQIVLQSGRDLPGEDIDFDLAPSASSLPTPGPLPALPTPVTGQLEIATTYSKRTSTPLDSRKLAKRVKLELPNAVQAGEVQAEEVQIGTWNRVISYRQKEMDYQNVQPAALAPAALTPCSTDDHTRQLLIELRQNPYWLNLKKLCLSEARKSQTKCVFWDDFATSVVRRHLCRLDCKICKETFQLNTSKTRILAIMQLPEDDLWKGYARNTRGNRHHHPFFFEISHLCNSSTLDRPCMNPRHLRLESNPENLARVLHHNGTLACFDEEPCIGPMVQNTLTPNDRKRMRDEPASVITIPKIVLKAATEDSEDSTSEVEEPTKPKPQKRWSIQEKQILQRLVDKKITKNMAETLLPGRSERAIDAARTKMRQIARRKSGPLTPFEEQEINKRHLAGEKFGKIATALDRPDQMIKTHLKKYFPQKKLNDS